MDKQKYYYVVAVIAAVLVYRVIKAGQDFDTAITAGFYDHETRLLALEQHARRPWYRRIFSLKTGV